MGEARVGWNHGWVPPYREPRTDSAGCALTLYAQCYRTDWCDGLGAGLWFDLVIGGSPFGHPPYYDTIPRFAYTFGMPDYRRSRAPGGTYFFTVNLLERRRDLLVRHIDALREAVRVTRRQRPFRIDACVVLPDHPHCVWTLPPGDADFSNRWKAIKIRFVQAIPQTERRSKVRVARSERGVWQRRFREHAIRNDVDYARHIAYVHWNPMKHGLVERLADWPYSSFHRFVRMGLLSSDWAGGLSGREAEYGERQSESWIGPR